MSKEIGGYFELEHNNKGHYHQNAIKLNAARYCIEYILTIKKYKKIYIPFYICDSILKPIENLEIMVQYYSINEELMPVINKKLGDNEVLLFINYFGLHSSKIQLIKEVYGNIIVDNTQAFFLKPIYEIDTVYSPRKFLGVSDGGYLYINSNKRLVIDRDISYDRYIHLLKRIDLGAGSGYKDFIETEKQIDNSRMLEMSNITSELLSNIDYEFIKQRRNENFNILNKSLKAYNELKVEEFLKDNSPMVYPFLINGAENLRKVLIDNNIYVAKYWADVLDRVNEESFEAYLTNNLLPLPIDQRYNEEDMRIIIDKIMKYIKENNLDDIS